MKATVTLFTARIIFNNIIIEMSSKSILGLNKFNNKEIKVKLCGGREVVGILRGFDAVTNLVLDETVEFMFGKLLPTR